MPVDLSAMLARARTISSDPEECAARFTEALQDFARNGDLLSYILYVHGDKGEELKALALSQHAHVIAADGEASSLTLHVLPPEFGKSALARSEAELWLGMETARAFETPRHTVPSAHYIMNTAMQSEKNIMDIEETIEHNKRFKELFPMVRPDKRRGWTKDHFFLDRPRSRPDPSLLGCGMFGPIQGSRVGFQVVDDPTDQQDARSDGLLDAQSSWLAGTAATRVLKNGIRRYRFTRWSEKDTFSRLSKVQGMLVRVMPALGFWQEHPEFGVTEKVLWPGLFPESRLESIRQELIDMGQAYLWQLQYLCNPTAASGDMFRRSWIIYGTPRKEAVAV